MSTMNKSKKKRQPHIGAIDENDIAIIKKKIINKEITTKEAARKYKIHPRRLRISKPTSCKDNVFTKDQEIALKEHIIKCSNMQYNLTISTMRSITYEYAVKLPGCKYPKQWDEKKMASMEWFRKFRSRHIDLKINALKYNSCICIMGCHMGPEGKDKLKQLEARVLIARVYHYLHKEYEYMKMSNDLSLLINILRRTAEATGVCEQTITSILDEEQKIQHSFDEDVAPAPDLKVKKRKKNENVMSEHDYICTRDSENCGESSHTNSSNQDSNTQNNETSSCVVNSEIESNMDTTNKDANTEINDTSNAVQTACTDFDSNVIQTVVEDSSPNNDNSDNMVYSNIESNVNSIVEIPLLEIRDISTNVSYSDLNSNFPVFEVSDDSDEEMAYSSMYSDFERLQQDASLIKSVQVEILEDDDEQNVKDESKEANMEVAFVEVDANKQNEKCDAEPTMEVTVAEFEKNKKLPDCKQYVNPNAKTDAMSTAKVPVEEKKKLPNCRQSVNPNAKTDAKTTAKVPVEKKKKLPNCKQDALLRAKAVAKTMKKIHNYRKLTNCKQYVNTNVKTDAKTTAIVPVEEKKKLTNCKQYVHSNANMDAKTTAKVPVEEKKKLQDVHPNAKADPNAKAKTRAIVPVEEKNQAAKPDGEVDNMTLEIIPMDLCKKAVTTNGTLKLSLLTVESNEVSMQERDKTSEEEECINIEDDSNDVDDTFGVQRDPRSPMKYLTIL